MPSKTDSPQGYGLDSVEATSRLCAAITQVLPAPTTYASRLTGNVRALVRPDTLLLLLASGVFLAQGCLTSPSLSPDNQTGNILTGAFTLTLLAARILFLPPEEDTVGLISLKMHRLVHRLRTHGMARAEDGLFAALAPAQKAHIVLTLRDRILQPLPTHLLVPDDVVQLFIGQVAPVDLVGLEEMEGVVLEEGDRFTALHVTSNFSYEKPIKALFRVVAPNPPVAQEIKGALEAARSRPNPPSATQHQIFVRLWGAYLTTAIWALAFLAGILRLVCTSSPSSSEATSTRSFYLLAYYPVLAVSPLLLLRFSILSSAVRAYATARVLTLFHALSESQEEFRDDDSDDAFDAEGAPPTKEVHIDERRVWREVFRHGLWESQNAPFPEQWIVMNPEGEATSLEVRPGYGPRGRWTLDEDGDWQGGMDGLRPLGLACHLTSSHLACPHHRPPGGLSMQRFLTGEGSRELCGRLGIFSIEEGINARQVCLCDFAKAVGIAPGLSQGFVRQVESMWLTNQGTEARMTSWSLQGSHSEDREGWKQHFLQGDPSLILAKCTDYWSGSGINGLDDPLAGKEGEAIEGEGARASLKDIIRKATMVDRTCVALAYRPCPFGGMEDEMKSKDLVIIPEEEEEEKRKGEDGEELGGWVFLGFVVFCDVIKPDVCDFLQDLGVAGIRFVYFSPFEERRSKAFADRLGLETDWNTCIRLRDPTAGSAHDEDEGGGEGNDGVEGTKEREEDMNSGTAHTFPSHHVDVERLQGRAPEFHEMSVLPNRGSIDRGASVKYNEDGESDEEEDWAQTEEYWDERSKARLPQGIEEIRRHIAEVDDIPLQISLFAESNAKRSEGMMQILQEEGEVILCIGSTLNPAHTILFSVGCLGVGVEPFRRRIRAGGLAPATGSRAGIVIGEGRRLVGALQQAMLFACGVVWLSIVPVPLLAVSSLGTEDVEVIKHMPRKNKGHLGQKKRLMLLWTGRFLISVLLGCLTYILALYSLMGHPSDILSQCDDQGMCEVDLGHREALRKAQLYTFAVLLFHLLIISSTFTTRLVSLISSPPYRNGAWMAAATLSILLSAALILPLYFLDRENVSAPTPPLSWYVHVVSWVPPVLLVLPLEEIVKALDARAFRKWQRRRKLEFNTKLGMHSPV
ncbi:hypothetical protein BJ684DRAFT_14315 [Piptocephalis cylindrospora]|uniref:Cation-transporting P-type ATPase C-terminal domain-containing protein n=1 Tax=Piptocephalis cylindrospora TaxID=1907219 RepID=A0A4P9Y8D7_9FUNG|nr:hypothetical protein BJ684DRAFT_14315 [Piptocephalis cylindrospora]|eukprot:RKP15426.1 hypothetical protein BJ684DRAFT_14315 [Piptocephalis cylindrospora]